MNVMPLAAALLLSPLLAAQALAAAAQTPEESSATDFSQALGGRLGDLRARLERSRLALVQRRSRATLEKRLREYRRAYDRPPIDDSAVDRLHIAIGVSKDRLKGLAAHVGLQGDTNTCVRYAIAAALWVQGVDIDGQRVRDASFDLVRHDILDGSAQEKAAADRLRQYVAAEGGLAGQLSRPALWNSAADPKPLVFPPGAITARDQDVLDVLKRNLGVQVRIVDQVGMADDDGRLAEKLGYGAEVSAQHEWALKALEAAWEGRGPAEAFWTASSAIKRSLDFELRERGEPLVVDVSLAYPDAPSGGLHSVALLGKTLEGGALIFDSNQGLILVPWDDFWPFFALSVTPSAPGSAKGP